jgi:peptide/nickel transport system permease protein
MSGLAAPLAGRALGALARLLLVAALLHVLLRMAPGDAIDALPAGEAQRAALTAAWGLDRGLVQVLFDLLRGNLGESLVVRPGQPVAALIGEAAATSAPLLLGALGLSLGLGALAAARPGLRLLLAPASAAPAFLLGFVLISGINELTFALIQAGQLDPPSWFALPDAPSALRGALAAAALAVGSGNLSATSAGLAEAWARAESSPWAEALRARGQPTRGALARALVAPAAGLIGSRALHLIGGLVVIEKVFLIHGAGALLWRAALDRDLPLALGLGISAAAATLGLGLAAELLRLAADPRLRGAP